MRSGETKYQTEGGGSNVAALAQLQGETPAQVQGEDQKHQSQGRCSKGGARRRDGSGRGRYRCPQRACLTSGPRRSGQTQRVRETAAEAQKRQAQERSSSIRRALALGAVPRARLSYGRPVLPPSPFAVHECRGVLLAVTTHIGGSGWNLGAHGQIASAHRDSRQLAALICASRCRHAKTGATT